MAINGENIAPVFAMQGTDAFSTSRRSVWKVGPVVEFKGAGIAGT